jgi:uncharacterized protein DUF4350
MMRTWIGLALLAASWLAAVGYYAPANLPLWTVAVVISVILLAQRPGRLPPRRILAVTVAMLIPAIWLLPWPYRAWPLLIVLGLSLQMVAIPRRWPKAVGWGALRAGLVILSLSLLTEVYATCTARCHDLPSGLAWLLGMVARLLGFETAVDGKAIVIHSMAHVHRLSATWDLLVDPATLGFLVGGLVLLALPGATAGLSSSASVWKDWLRASRTLALVVAVWLPVRAGLLMAIMLDRGLRADPDVPLGLMNQFFDAWVYLLCLAVPVLLAWRFVRIEAVPQSGHAADNDESNRSEKAPASKGPRLLSLFAPRTYAFIAERSTTTLGIAAICVSVTLLSILVYWDPVGRPKNGRVIFVERHSEWEPTDRAYDTESYGEDASYNYARIYDYCGQYFHTSRLLESDKINDATLAECDVLVVKTPTARYAGTEVAAIERFVASGGGLLLIGEHTNIDRMSTYLNDICAKFGFKYRHDLLYTVGSPYVQWVTRPTVPHPAVQRVPTIRYAVSCSIDPGRSLGRAAVQNTGLWNLPPDYNSANYFPHAHYRADMRFGAFIQTWATRHGSGRVMAFTDSTIFSNFSTFEPGKPELMIGMLQWLNHRSWLDDGWLRLLVVLPLLAAAVAGLVIGWKLCRGRPYIWPLILGACTLGWFVAAVTVSANQEWAMPRLKNQRPMVRVVLDRTVSDAPLSAGGFAPDDGLGYALMEQWISRLGYYTTRQTSQAAFSGDALVIIAPTLSVTQEYREALIRYVSSGGKLLVFDSPDVEGSTANSLLWPFDLEVSHATPAEGTLRTDDDWPAIELGAVCQVRGGEPFMWIGDTPVAARTDFGEGSVMAVGFGSLMNDSNMGYSWMAEPGEMERTVYDLLFTLVRSLVEDRSGKDR